jgi:hypothetical protein
VGALLLDGWEKAAVGASAVWEMLPALLMLVWQSRLLMLMLV